MNDNTQEKNYVGSLVRLLFNDGNGEVETLYTVFEQNGSKLTLRRTDTNKDMIVPVMYLLQNRHFQVL